MKSEVPAVAAPTSHLQGLNPEQRRAASHTEGPVLILAGAGSGKTKTLVHRIAHLIRVRKAAPSSIVALTFTNKAAEEMRERVRSYVGTEARQVVLSTFHSLGVRILRTHAERMSLPKKFAIYSTSDQLAALKTACAEVSIEDDSFDLKRILRQISDWKTRRITPPEAMREVADAAAKGNRSDAYAVLSADAYPRYEEVLRASGAVDFDDLLLLPVQLLQRDEEARLDLWKRWHYIMIDEYQDTNAVQLELARLLAGQRRNLCVVGDDDQSIYAFRGADVGNILEFEQHFPGAQIVKLEQNYRSTRRILGAANAIIAGNTRRHAKQLHTENGVGAQIDYYEHENDIVEADTVGREIALRKFTQKLQWGEIAVLYRTNTQSRPLEESLREKNVPYRVIGGTSFFEKKEVADAIAYLRAVAFPRDEIAVRRIINYPTRGIGRGTILRIAELAQQSGAGFVKTMEGIDASDVGAVPARGLREFEQLMHDARAGLHEAEFEAAGAPPGDKTPIARWAGALIDRIGLEDAIRADPRNERSLSARSSNLRDLVGSITRYERRVWNERLGLVPRDGDDMQEWKPPTLSDALARLSLADFDDNEDEPDERNTVALMTLHSAKGLEFNDVFIVGLEEGILPHSRSIDEAAASVDLDPLSEERRLLYVGITRARQRLTLSSCRTRKRAAAELVCLPSRYIVEIPTELLNIKTSDTPMLAPEESAELRKNFFTNMKSFLEKPE